MVPGRWIVWAAEIAAQTRSQAYGIAEQSGWAGAVFFAYARSTSPSMSENSTSAGRSGHCLPSKVISMIRHAVPVFDAPPQAVPAQAFLRLLNACDGARTEQEPFDRLSVTWPGNLADVHHPQLDGRLGAVLRRGQQLDLTVAQRHLGRPLGMSGPGLLLAFLRPGTLARHVNAQVGLSPCATPLNARPGMAPSARAL